MIGIRALTIGGINGIAGGDVVPLIGDGTVVDVASVIPDAVPFHLNHREMGLKKTTSMIPFEVSNFVIDKKTGSNLTA